MIKKPLLAVAFAALAFGFTAKAQTNLQTFYDFGRDRDHFTTTLEGFYNDNWGNTFFFIDYDYNAKDDKKVNQAPSGSYMEIARCLNFWQDSPLAPLSLQVEYNGLVGVNQNFLFGVDYFLHNTDFSTPSISRSCTRLSAPGPSQMFRCSSRSSGACRTSWVSKASVSAVSPISGVRRSSTSWNRI